jgi:hypothetical protein
LYTQYELVLDLVQGSDVSILVRISAHSGTAAQARAWNG